MYSIGIMEQYNDFYLDFNVLRSENEQNNCYSFGYPGYKCLLRLICDIAVDPVNFSNGVLGDLFHVFLTPSSSNDNEYLEDYLKAEEHGYKEGNCLIYKNDCSHSILDLFTKVLEIDSMMGNITTI